MAEYLYTREVTLGVYNVNNPARADYLAKEVEVALPGKVFILRCNAGEVKFIFDDTLTAGEQTTLSNAVDAHKNNT